jgi:exopolysaccharide biosynthesis WecB/TagA/CpsF family protein
LDSLARPELLECRFDPLTLAEAVDLCLGWCLGPRVPRTVVTANAAVLCQMRRDPELGAACRRADLLVADGMSVVWTSRLAGIPFPERVAGIDLMSRLLEEASALGLSAYFLGARAEVVAELVRRCAKSFPGLTVAGSHHGYFAPAEHDRIVAQVRESEAHLLFVGMPSPFKETWCERHRLQLNVPVMMGVGGSFDVLAGYVPRAPRRVQSLGLEWLWRLAMEPRRMWRRYLTTNLEFAWRAAGEIRKHRAARAGAGAHIEGREFP